MVSGRREMLSGNTVGDSMSTEARVVLPENEQVSRGQELLQMLREQSLLSASCDSARITNHSDAKAADVDVKVIVKHTFIEVVDPQCLRRKLRSMSDSALLDFACDSEQPWQKISSDKFQDLSDASTTISKDDEGMSNEGEELSAPFGGHDAVRKDTCWSDDEGAMEMPMQQCMPYPYVDSWWMMPMGFDPNATIICAPMADGTTMSGTSYMPQQWADQCDIDCEDADGEGDSREWRTTVMLRNMPNNYTRDMLLDLVNSMGFSGCYDFAYLPVDFKSQAGLGYAFINFISTAEAQRCFECFEGFSEWKVPSEKVCTVTWGSPYQGLEAHIERYQNSPVMHQSIPDEWKPVLLENGRRVPFPAPTKAIKTPKMGRQPRVPN
jgi:hypothetical protein